MVWWLIALILQLDSADEQAAAIRRELDGRMQRVQAMEHNRKLMPKFVLKDMESMYVEELKSSINLLMANLESLPVSKGDPKYGIKKKMGKYNNRWGSYGHEKNTNFIGFLFLWLDENWFELNQASFANFHAFLTRFDSSIFFYCFFLHFSLFALRALLVFMASIFFEFFYCFWFLLFL